MRARCGQFMGRQAGVRPGRQGWRGLCALRCGDDGCGCHINSLIAYQHARPPTSVTTVMTQLRPPIDNGQLHKGVRGREETLQSSNRLRGGRCQWPRPPPLPPPGWLHRGRGCSRRPRLSRAPPSERLKTVPPFPPHHKTATTFTTPTRPPARHPQSARLGARRAPAGCGPRRARPPASWHGGSRR